MNTTDRRPRKAPRIVPGHRISWFVYAGGSGQSVVKLRHTANMRGWWMGYDAECECGWKSSTGGAIRGYVQDKVREHKWDVTGDVTHIFERPA